MAATPQQQIIALLLGWIGHVADAALDDMGEEMEIQREDGFVLTHGSDLPDAIDLMFCCHPRDWLPNDLIEETMVALLAVEADQRLGEDHSPWN